MTQPRPHEAAMNMSEGWIYVEPFCGSAAVAVHLLGSTQAILPYQGSKWKFRRQLTAKIRELGYHGLPRRMRLVDVGPWGVVAPLLLEKPSQRNAQAIVRERIQVFHRMDPRAVFDVLHDHPVPAHWAEYAAQFLFLQRLAYSGKAVGEKKGKWVSPGFNDTSAYGVEATTKFGAVRPMIGSLIGVLESLEKRLTLVEQTGLAYNEVTSVVGAQGAAREPSEVCQRPTLVYLDPPYQDSTNYPCGTFTRGELLSLARTWRAAGASIILSESEPIEELVREGWNKEQLVGMAQGDSPFKRSGAKGEEWVTYVKAEEL
jgi:site-specific DNA-adenine methylase